MTNQSITDYIRTLKYDPRSLLSVQADGSTESLPTKDRQASGNAVIICTKKKHSLKKNLDGVAILRPTGGVIFPGALVYADQNLMEGQPTPIAINMGSIKLSVDLPGLQSESAPISDPTNSSIHTYLNGILETWNKQPASMGYINAARSSLQVSTAFSSQQVGLDLGFSADWAGGNVSSKLGLSSSSEKSVAIAFYRQIFYSVTMDTPSSPSTVFAEDVTLDQIKQVIHNGAVPAYVRSVDYGRILMITMETSTVDTMANLEAALSQTLNGGANVGGSIASGYENIVKNAKFSVIAIGGGAATAASFSGNEEDLKSLGQYLEKDATYRRDNPGAPISYTVAFLKDNSLAQMGFTTEYTETDCIRYPNGFIKIRHNGAYVAKFMVSWEEANKDGNFASQSWESGQKTAGYTYQLDLPGDARNVKIHGLAATGLAWDPWGDAINVTEDGPTNKTYRIYGSTLNRKYEIHDSNEPTLSSPN